jgi:hypothetical protein
MTPEVKQVVINFEVAYNTSITAIETSVLVLALYILMPRVHVLRLKRSLKMASEQTKCWVRLSKSVSHQFSSVIVQNDEPWHPYMTSGTPHT